MEAPTAVCSFWFVNLQYGPSHHLCCRLHVYSFTKPQLWCSDVALLDHRNLYLAQDKRIDVSIKILDLGNLRSHLARRGRVRPSPIMLIHQPAHIHVRSIKCQPHTGSPSLSLPLYSILDASICASLTFAPIRESMLGFERVQSHAVAHNVVLNISRQH